MTQILIHGIAGRMGQALLNAAADMPDVTIAAGVDKPDMAQTAGDVPVHGAIGDCPEFDVLIDFSRPEASLAALQACVDAGKAFVSGTTGLSAEQQASLDEAASKIPVLTAPNFSIGVNLSLQLIRQAAAVLGDDYDVEVIGAHHRLKVDSPSGTALAMGQAAADGLGRNLEECAVYGREGQHGVRPDKEIGFVTIHAGDIVGDHTLLFAGQGERVEITHKASDRGIFARGALRAAAWVAGKPAGRYSMADVLGLN